jgi:competence protein ComEC
LINKIKRLNFPLVFAAYLSVLLYFCIWRFSWLLFLISVLSIGLALYRRYWAIFPILFLVAGLCGFVRADEKRQEAQPSTALHQLAANADSISVNGDLLSFRGSDAGRNYQAYYTLKTKEEQALFKTLSESVLIIFDGKLERPEGQRNFAGFDSRRYLASQNIYQIVKIERISAVSAQKKVFDLHALRRKAILWCEQHFPAPMSRYMTGLLFGYLPKDFSEIGDVYTSLGLIHLFALSGMHVNFFINALRKLLLRAGLRQDIVNFVQLPLSIFYAFLAGLAPSVIRALLQKNAQLIHFKGLENVALSFFALLIVMPKFLLTTGGQLTLFYAFFLAMIKGLFPHLGGLKKAALESSVLSLGVLPLLLLNFHVFQPLSIPLTLVFSFLFEVAMLPLIVAFFFSSFTGLSFSGFNFLFQGLEGFVTHIGHVIHYPMVLGKPNLLLFLSLLLTIGLFIDFRRRKKWCFLLLTTLLALFFLTKNPINSSITMVDVGQGDSFLLQDRFNQQTVLIDTGGRVAFGTKESWQEAQGSSNADKTLIPYLKSVGIGQIDKLILTHTDSDHMGDLLALADKIQVKEIWTSPGSVSNAAFLKTLSATKARIPLVKVGDSIPIFQSRLQILSSGYTGKGDNNDSVVAYGVFFRKSFLFTGDLEREGEKELLAAYPHLKVDVLKAGHHGSKTSSGADFIAAVKPQIALVSAGVNNRYRHPNDETLRTFEQNQVQIYRTDQQGAVKFIEKFGNWQIETVK